MLLIKNPAGANEAIRTLVEGRAPRVAVSRSTTRSPTARTSRGSGTSTSSLCSTGLEHARRDGRPRRRARAAVQVRGLRAGANRGRSPTSKRTRARPRGIGVLPRSSSSSPPTRRCSRCGSRSASVGARSAVLGAARREDPRRAPLPGLPQHLRRPREHRRARAARGVARSRARRGSSFPWATPSVRASTTCSTSAAARIASRRSSRVDLAAKADAVHEAVAGGAAVLAVCGGYQLLGRFYRDRDGVELPGIGLLPLHTIAGERRMIGDVLLDCEWAGRTLAGFENHAGRTLLDDGAKPLGRVVHGFGNDGESGFEGCRAGRVIGTYLHGPLLPRNPWLADWVLAQALAHASGGEVAGARAARRTSSSARRTASPPAARGRAAAASSSSRARLLPRRQASSSTTSPPSTSARSASRCCSRRCVSSCARGRGGTSSPRHIPTRTSAGAACSARTSAASASTRSRRRAAATRSSCSSCTAGRGQHLPHARGHARRRDAVRRLRRHRAPCCGRSQLGVLPSIHSLPRAAEHRSALGVREPARARDRRAGARDRHRRAARGRDAKGAGVLAAGASRLRDPVATSATTSAEWCRGRR